MVLRDEQHAQRHRRHGITRHLACLGAGQRRNLLFIPPAAQAQYVDQLPGQERKANSNSADVIGMPLIW